VEALAQKLTALDPARDDYAVNFVERLLQEAVPLHVNDIHLQPVRDGIEVRVRRDGMLRSLGIFPVGKTSDVVTRLKVLANLLTYQPEQPQEGRIRDPQAFSAEMRVSTFPTLFGERAVIRVLHVDDTPTTLSHSVYPTRS